MHKSCSKNEHTGFESENKSGRMKGEKKSDQIICDSQVKFKFTIAMLCHWSDER